MKRVAVAVAVADEALREAAQVVRALRAPIDVGATVGACDAVLGAIELEGYARVQPARLLDARLCPLRDKREVDVDFVVYGEMGAGGAERVCRAAFEAARKPGRRRRVLLAGEALRAGFVTVAREHSDVGASAASVEAAAEQMVRTPEKLDIIVVDRVYAGVLASIGVALAGGAGLAAWASLGPCPVFCGRGAGAIRAAAMMLDHLGLAGEAARVDAAVRRALGEDRAPRDLGGNLSIAEFGAVVRRYL